MMIKTMPLEFSSHPSLCLSYLQNASKLIPITRQKIVNINDTIHNNDFKEGTISSICYSISAFSNSY
jgi:hypothetical protein